MFRPPLFKISSCGADFLSCSIFTKNWIPTEGRINVGSILYWNFIIKAVEECVPKCVAYYFHLRSDKSEELPLANSAVQSDNASQFWYGFLSTAQINKTKTRFILTRRFASWMIISFLLVMQ